MTMEATLTPVGRTDSSAREAAHAVPPKMSIRNLDFFYGESQALKSVNFDIAEREVTAFIGPSGCGKSTLLRTLNRMYSLYPRQRATGEIRFNGRNILDAATDVNLLRAKVGMVFQKPTPFPMSIYDNIAFGVRLYERLSARQMDERVEWALTKAAMWNEAKDKLRQSGMMPQSTTRRPATPMTRSCGSTTLLVSSAGPIRVVPLGWKIVPPVLRAKSSNASSVTASSPGRYSLATNGRIARVAARLRARRIPATSVARSSAVDR